MARTVASPTDSAGSDAASGNPKTNEIRFAAFRGSPIRGFGRSCPRNDSSELKLAGAAGNETDAIDELLLRKETMSRYWFHSFYRKAARGSNEHLCAAHKGFGHAPMLIFHRWDG